MFKAPARIASIFLGTAIIAAVPLSSASTAQAGGPTSKCYNSGSVACLYDGASYSGTLWLLLDAGGPRGECAFQFSVYGGGNNKASSVYNNTPYYQFYYTGLWTGFAFTLNPHSGKSSLPAEFNNKLSSMETYCDSN